MLTNRRTMFVTQDAFKSPLSGMFGEPGQHHWLAVELALAQHWFMAQVVQRPLPQEKDPQEIDRTLFLSRLTDLTNLAQPDPSGGTRLTSAFIVMPTYAKGGMDWRMDRLRAVWVADEPNSSEGVEESAEVIETDLGVMYNLSLHKTPVVKLRNRTLVCKFPAPKKGKKA